MQATDTIYEIINVSEITNVRFFTFEQNGCYFPNHWHKAVEIIYMLKGDLFITVNQQKFHITSAQCFSFNANVIQSTKATAYCQYILLQIPYDFLEKYIPHIQQFAFELNDGHTNPQAQQKINLLKRMLLRMRYYNEKQPEGFALMLNSFLFRLIYFLFHNFKVKLYERKTANQIKERTTLNTVLEYTVQNYTKVISLNEIAQVAKFEPKYFCRFFKKHMGITYKNYQNELRLSHIYQDLTTSDIPIASILEKHGFTNYKLFRQMFRERFGSTPTQIRKMAQK